MIGTVNIVIEKHDGEYVAYSPDIVDSHTDGYSLDEVIENIKKRIELYFENMNNDVEENESLTKKKDLSKYLPI